MKNFKETPWAVLLLIGVSAFLLVSVATLFHSGVDIVRVWK